MYFSFYFQLSRGAITLIRGLCENTKSPYTLVWSPTLQVVRLIPLLNLNAAVTVEAMTSISITLLK